jgi:hypothetical protein
MKMQSIFEACTIKDFYETMLFSARKMDFYLDQKLSCVFDKQFNSGKYIDAEVSYKTWEDCYNSARERLEEKFGKPMRRQIVKMIDADLQLESQRKKIFG